MKYRVYRTERVYYLLKEIEAKDKKEAKEKYMKKWRNGEIGANEIELLEFEAEEIK